MFPTALMPQPYNVQKEVLANFRRNFSRSFSPFVRSRAPELEDTVASIISAGLYRVNDGGTIDFANFTIRLDDEVAGDIPAYERIVRMNMNSPVAPDCLILHACTFMSPWGPSVSWAIAKASLVADFMRTQTGTCDVRNAGQGVLFRRLPFEVMRSYFGSRVFYQIGALLAPAENSHSMTQ